jgi:hypothetical protein
MLSRGFITWAVSLNVASKLKFAYQQRLEKVKHEHHVETQMGRHREILAHARAEREMNEMKCNSDEKLQDMRTEFETRLKSCRDKVAESSHRIVEYETICATLRSESENAERSFKVQRAKLESDLEIAKQNYEEQRKAMLAEQERTSKMLRAKYEDNLARKVMDMTQTKDEDIERLELDSRLLRSELEEKYRKESREVLRIRNELEIEHARFESREQSMRDQIESAAQDAHRVREDLRDERKRASEWKRKLVECSENASRDVASWSRKFEDERLKAEMENTTLNGKVTEFRLRIESMNESVQRYHEMTQGLRARIAKCENEEAMIARERDSKVTECTSLQESYGQNLEYTKDLEERLEVASRELLRSKTSVSEMKKDFESKVNEMSSSHDVILRENEVLEMKKRDEVKKLDHSLNVLRTELEQSHASNESQARLLESSNVSIRETKEALKTVRVRSLYECDVDVRA